MLKYWVRRFHDFTIEGLRACVEVAINDYCGPDAIRQAYNTMFRFLYMYSVQEATTALQQEKQRKGAAQRLRGAMATAQQGDEGAKQHLLCLSRYQALMHKHYLSHRRPARSLEQLAENAIPDHCCGRTASTGCDGRRVAGGGMNRGGVV